MRITREGARIRNRVVLVAIGTDWESRRNVLLAHLANRESHFS